jgi:hypothetical protein
MKNLSILIAAIALMCSCSKKDWSCSCEISGTANNNGTKTKTIMGKTKSLDNSECGEYGKALIAGNGVYKCKVTEL